MVGTAGLDYDLKPRPKAAHIFIHNLDKNCSKTTLASYMKKKKIEPIDIRQTSKEDWLSASFKVAVHDKDKEVTLQEGFWPSGVRCREWIALWKAKETKPVEDSSDPNGTGSVEHAANVETQANDSEVDSASVDTSNHGC